MYSLAAIVVAFFYAMINYIDDTTVYSEKQTLRNDAAGAHQYKMNNTRSDTMLSKASYRRPLEKGQRCVVLADGFYEWNTTKSGKQPYYIYFKDGGPGEGKLVTMAGIFERREQDGDETFSFSVITVDAHTEFSWLHHRMPAMLENEEEVCRWLDFGSVPMKEANNLIKPKSCLAWHPVATTVNNSRNNLPECIEKIDLSAKTRKQNSESTGMMKWLSRASDTKSDAKCKRPHQSGEKRKSKDTALDSWLKRAKN